MPRSKRKYQILADGEGVELPSEKRFLFACCDCGLVHDVIIVSQDGKPVGFAVQRNNRATAGRRRQKKFKTFFEEFDPLGICASRRDTSGLEPRATTPKRRTR